MCDFFTFSTSSIQTATARVRQPHLPEKTNLPYKLRDRSHHKTLINKTKFLNDNDFIVRMLYKHSSIISHACVYATIYFSVWLRLLACLIFKRICYVILCHVGTWSDIYRGAQWRRLHGHGDTCPPLLQMAGYGGTA